MHKIIFRLIISFLLIFSIAACEDRKKANIIIVGTSADNPPYEFIQDGKLVGFDIDLINEIAKYLNWQVEFKDMEFYNLLAALSSANVDMVAAGLSATPERKNKIDFSLPYTEAKVAILYRTEDNYRSPEDLKGKLVGTQLGTIWGPITDMLAKQHDFKVQMLANNFLLVEDLKVKRIDAIVLEYAQARKFAANTDDFSKIPLADLNSVLAIGFPKNSPLKKDVDLVIKTLKRNGTIKSLQEKWGIQSGK